MFHLPPDRHAPRQDQASLTASVSAIRACHPHLRDRHAVASIAVENVGWGGSRPVAIVGGGEDDGGEDDGTEGEARGQWLTEISELHAASTTVLRRSC